MAVRYPIFLRIGLFRDEIQTVTLLLGDTMPKILDISKFLPDKKQSTLDMMIRKVTKFPKNDS